MPNRIVEFTAPATSVPVAATFSDAHKASAVFTPMLGRQVYLTLQGTWDGVVQVQRSVDGGTTWNNVTESGGRPHLRYIGNCDEEAFVPTDAAATYRLDITLNSGSVTFRIAQ